MWFDQIDVEWETLHQLHVAKLLLFVVYLSLQLPSLHLVMLVCLLNGVKLEKQTALVDSCIAHISHKNVALKLFVAMIIPVIKYSNLMINFATNIGKQHHSHGVARTRRLYCIKHVYHCSVFPMVQQVSIFTPTNWALHHRKPQVLLSHTTTCRKSLQQVCSIVD